MGVSMLSELLCRWIIEYKIILIIYIIIIETNKDRKLR